MQAISPGIVRIGDVAPDSAGSPPRVDVDDSIERDVLVRLCHVRWCQLHSPLPLGPTLLQLEEISLAAATPDERDRTWEDPGPQTLSAGPSSFTATFAERWLVVGNPI